MFAKLKQRRLRGKLYVGPTAWCDDPQIVAWPGFYALSADGKTILADVPLVCVDDAPGDPEDGSTHFEHRTLREHPQRRADGGKITQERIVNVEVHAEGKAAVNA